jgi:signal transduction histidine kinase
MVRSDPARDEPVRILLVDDNAANLLALQAVLEPLGQELVVARSGMEALELLGHQEFALVLMDVHMPVLDGYQTVEAIRERDELRHLPVVFVTAIFKDEDSAARGYSLGAVDFITKPYVPEVIRAKVSTFVMLTQHQRERAAHERRLAEEQAARAAAELAARSMEDFIAILGHDLRNPLNAIMMMAEQHGARHDAAGECAQFGERIARSARRMNRLIGDLVDFAKSRHGGIALDYQDVDMCEVARVPLDELQLIHPRQRVELRTSGDVRGEWDPERVNQVLANLLDNAFKYGGGSIEVTLEDRGDRIAMEVHNDGTPIPADRLEHVFEPFERGRPGPQGLGLGLYIVDQIVKAHGGTIRVSSTWAAGTTFAIEWPRRQPSAATSAAP